MTLTKRLLTISLILLSFQAIAAWEPISFTVPQYVDSNGDPCSGCVLKFYAAGTTTNISLATDSTGGTTATDALLNSSGFPTVSGTVIIPHIDQTYKLALYPDQASADADSGATWTIDNLSSGSAGASEWTDSGLTPTYSSGTVFTLSGDQTDEFHVGRRLLITDSGGTDYATITASSFAASTTTVTVSVDDGGSIDSGISAVSYSFLSGDNPSYPTLEDDKTFIVDDDDKTKRLRFDVGNITTGTDRTITIPDANWTAVSDPASLSTAQEYTATQNFNETALTSTSNSVAWDASSNQVAYHLLTENTTIAAPSNQVDGAFYSLMIQQDASSAYTVAYNAVFKFPGGSAPTMSTGNNAIDIITFRSDGTSMYMVGLVQDVQ